ncbi:Dihydrolipoyllysine-residue acetyltransferase component of pyruvate dehydrogenase complex [Anaerohalosphaera lusitana]|uniref:Dihydrolipoamide acetyltransferase component of pyruvate dehydrogenase complex n=1 Tax=Anaerohalosphaera lusitana TaxID=1936003 RepID=A0A1U9NQ27_9BACT|nr:dihydrolipoamide acetyltransferase family protein [Anaerohalosphaera lusitana]AQT69616.1 Dihydrolipoyllysine-residue acetyltransferase component of pyruvate dehydrogenase complex [Anaerohalosphaera lusitana]
MAEKVPMIALSPTMEDGHIVKWVKEEGEQVDTGEVLCEVETDKATMEYESTFEGTLLKIVVPEGESAKVGQMIAVIGEEGEDISELLKEEPSEPEEKEKTEAQKQEPEETAEEEPIEEGAEEQTEPKEQKEEPKEKPKPQPAAAKTKSSPLARKIAQEHGIDIEQIEGSGPDGRVVEADVKKAVEQGTTGKTAPAAAAPAEFTEKTEKVSQKRWLIAKRMTESKFSAPHYYLKVSVQMDDLMASRSRINEKLDGKISLNAILLKLIAQTLTKHPTVNASWNDDSITMHGRVDIGVAVAQKDGLIAPVVRNCETKTIRQIDSELRDLIDKARTGSLSSGSYSNPTFTISNLGAMGIEEFTAIINQPASAILAIGQITPTPIINGSGEFDAAKIMKLTLACDHRVIDGAVGAAFLSELKQTLENPLQAVC